MGLAPVQTSPGAHPAPYTMGTGSFLGVEWPGSGVDHPPPSSGEVKERVELYLYSTPGSSWPVIGWTLFYMGLKVCLSKHENNISWGFLRTTCRERKNRKMREITLQFLNLCFFTLFCCNIKLKMFGWGKHKTCMGNIRNANTNISWKFYLIATALYHTRWNNYPHGENAANYAAFSQGSNHGPCIQHK
jgi:hypothetical protein